MSNIQKYEFIIDNKKVLECTFVSKAKNKTEIQKRRDFFNLPKAITDIFYVSNPKFLFNSKYSLKLNTKSDDNKRQIEELLTNLYFDLLKTASIREYYSQVNDLAAIKVQEARKLLVATNLIPNERLDIIKFNWSNKDQVRSLPNILKHLVLFHSDVKQLKRELKQNKLFKVLEENRNNPYFAPNQKAMSAKQIKSELN